MVGPALAAFMLCDWQLWLWKEGLTAVYATFKLDLFHEQFVERFGGGLIPADEAGFARWWHEKYPELPPRLANVCIWRGVEEKLVNPWIDTSASSSTRSWSSSRAAGAGSGMPTRTGGRPRRWGHTGAFPGEQGLRRAHGDRWVILGASTASSRPTSRNPRPLRRHLQRPGDEPRRCGHVGPQIREQGLDQFPRIIDLCGKGYRAMVEQALAPFGRTAEYPFAGLSTGPAMQASRDAAPGRQGARRPASGAIEERRARCTSSFPGGRSSSIPSGRGSGRRDRSWTKASRSRPDSSRADIRGNLSLSSGPRIPTASSWKDRRRPRSASPVGSGWRPGHSNKRGLSAGTSSGTTEGAGS